MGLFRYLNADEIECRVGTCKDNGLSLLLYKDARCDMAILDETVGPFGWKREHTRDNANCTVSILDANTGQWVAKEDTGTESNTEATKGLASDSFKRACVNWGIGRELYTAPFIWIPADKCEIKYNQRSGKPACYNRFTVAKIETEGGRIRCIAIRNADTGQVVYSYVEKGYVPISRRGQAQPAPQYKEEESF